MEKAPLLYIIAIILVIGIVYLVTGFKFNKNYGPTTIESTIQQLTSYSTTTALSTTINYTQYYSSCQDFQLIGQQLNTTYIAKCQANQTSLLGLWVAGGISGKETVTIVGANGKVYANQNSTYNCTTFFQNFTLTPQIYTITLTTGLGNGSCGNSAAIINTTTLAPPIVYKYIYNGDFKSGSYAGWNVTGAGFGSAPLNITHSNAANTMCYNGQPWANYEGTFFATTYSCGLNVAPGNITSSAFYVNPTTPFLNFRIVSPSDNRLFIELMNQSYVINPPNRTILLTPVMIAHINTYNQSVTINASSTFLNVSLPLTPYVGKTLRVRVSASSFQNYIAVGDFSLANKPNEQAGVSVNISTAR